MGRVKEIPMLLKNTIKRSEEFVNFIQSTIFLLKFLELLDFSEKGRPFLDEAKNFPWIKTNYERIKHIETVNCEKPNKLYYELIKMDDVDFYNDKNPSSEEDFYKTKNVEIKAEYYTFKLEKLENEKNFFTNKEDVELSCEYVPSAKKRRGFTAKLKSREGG
jgi:hypothetical protein